MKVHIEATALRAVAIAASAAVAALAAPLARAASIDVGNPDLQVRWDNTLRYGQIWRLKSQDPVLLADPNQDDGNRNFNKGLVSHRVDLLSELDVAHTSGFGIRVSAAAWYDDVYNRKNDNPGFAGGAFPNHTPANEFPTATRDLMGRKAEFRDAFAYWQFDAAGKPGVVRLGKHALVWGESLFFSSNAIAGAQSPFDITRLVSDPTAQAKEYVLPVPQISGQLQLTPNVAIGAYYQFRFEPNRLSPVGSYFSTGDTSTAGGDRRLIPVAPGTFVPLLRNPDVQAKDSGQGGVQLKWNWEETDFGLHAIRFHSKNPVGGLNATLLPTPPFLAPTGYTVVYPESTSALAFTISRSFGSTNVALEAGYHRNQPLWATQTIFTTGTPINNSDNPAYAVGKTAHLNISSITTLPRTPLWDEASLTAEIAWNRMLSCTKNCNTLDPNITRDASGVAVVLQPTYRQVLPALDIDVPIAIQYAPKGSRSALGPGFPAEGGGSISLGLNATYETVWRIRLAYNHYLGDAVPTTKVVGGRTGTSFGQSQADRDYIAISVRRTF
jgi:hypothetical protein